MNAHRYARHPLMRAHAAPKRPLENGLRRRLVRRALRIAMARQAEATAAAVAALKKDRAAERREARIMKRGKRQPQQSQKRRRGREAYICDVHAKEGGAGDVQKSHHVKFQSLSGGFLTPTYKYSGIKVILIGVEWHVALWP